MKQPATLDDVDVGDKTVLVRIDANAPYDEETQEILDNARLRAHAETLRELSNRRAKTVVLAHQGRKGSPSFVSLKRHASLLEEHSGKRVQFSPHIVDSEARSAVESLSPGEILLLDNVRFLDDETLSRTPEEHSKSKLVAALSPICDMFVLDAFSVAHRSHASIVGFIPVLPSVRGRVLEMEVEALEKAVSPQRPNVYVLGGSKVDDCLDILGHMFEKDVLDNVLTTGVLGELFLMAQGYDLGDPTLSLLESKGLTERMSDVEAILRDHDEVVKTPVDVACEREGRREEVSVDSLPVDAPILDIGEETAETYSEFIADAKTVVVKGPAGVYEKPEFQKGTERILTSVASSDAFTLLGGGDTTTALDRIGMEANQFSYVSLSGGALITYLSGRPLPALEALRAG